MDNLSPARPFSYTIKEAAKDTGIPRTKLFALLKEGRVASAKIGKRRLILASSLQRFVEEHAA